MLNSFCSPKQPITILRTHLKPRLHHWRLYYSLHPLTPKISIEILLTVCHTVLEMLVWRIWSWSNSSPLIDLQLFLFLLLVCLIPYWYCKEKFCLGHSWELMGLTHESNTQYYMPKLEICSLLIVILWGIKFDHPIILLYLFVIALTLIQDCYWGLSSLGSWLKAKLSL